MDPATDLASKALTALAAIRALPDLTERERQWLEDRLLPPSAMMVERWEMFEAKLNDLQRQIDEMRGRDNGGE